MKLGRLTTLGIAIVLFGVVAAFAPSVVLATEDACASEGAVPDPDNNPGLVSDCAALLAARDTLAGAATLDWAAETPIAEWDGVIPRGTPLRVTMLLLQERQLTGEIPTELGNLSNLTGLYLGENQLTGEIPTELGNLSNLRELYLSDNQLTGEIPTELGNLSNLEWLSLWGNQLTGEIPTGLGSLSNLEWLDIASNQLTGEMLGNLSNLEWLDIASNQLTGEIPTETSPTWNGCPSGGTGEIPPELGGLSNLEWLGPVDGRDTAELGNLSNLQSLDLSDNQLTGEIPTGLGDGAGRPVQPGMAGYCFQPVDGRDTDGVGEPLQPAIAGPQ